MDGDLLAQAKVSVSWKKGLEPLGAGAELLTHALTREIIKAETQLHTANHMHPDFRCPIPDLRYHWAFAPLGGVA